MSLPVDARMSAFLVDQTGRQSEQAIRFKGGGATTSHAPADPT
jgi:hypothetical protein